MRPLPTTFQKNQFEFTQIERVGLVAIFSKQKGAGVPWSFEVVIIQQHHSYEKAGILFPSTESLPSSESWGKKGWTHTNLAAARHHFETLVSNPNSPFPPKRRK